nr:MAG TPA: hypothetical protein [Bacteriophage sp.]
MIGLAFLLLKSRYNLIAHSGGPYRPLPRLTKKK